MSRFTRILVVSPLADGNTWFLHEEFGYDVGKEQSGDTIDVPAGFLTDFASVPRPLWWLLPRWGRYGNAAVIHDYCYWDQSRSRREADRIFLEGMGVLGVGRVTRLLLFLGVRLFGWWAWLSARSRKRRGCVRIACRPPRKAVQTPEELLGAAPGSRGGGPQASPERRWTEETARAERERGDPEQDGTSVREEEPTKG